MEYDLTAHQISTYTPNIQTGKGCYFLSFYNAHSKYASQNVLPYPVYSIDVDVDDVETRENLPSLLNCSTAQASGQGLRPLCPPHLNNL